MNALVVVGMVKFRMAIKSNMPMTSGGSRILKGGFRCPERFRLRSCVHTRPATHAHKTTKKGGSAEPKEPPGSATVCAYVSLLMINFVNVVRLSLRVVAMITPSTGA